MAGPADRPPSVDQLARSLAESGLPHPLLVDVAREAIAAGAPSSATDRAREVARSLLGPVVNASGVLLHTNMGRAPLPQTSTPDGDAASGSPIRYSNLELDLATGRRGSRSTHAAGLLARATGAEAALVVNNGAGAVLLVLAAVAAGRPVPVSRGELVEIGGGFRVPDVMAQSGARLVEVGTTNRTRVADYEAALAAHPDVAIVLKVHQSNYRVVGFTESVEVRDLARLGPPVVVDLGSGLLDADTPWLGAGAPPAWLADEPAVRQTLEAGAGLVTFSGDKLFGGPQAGIIAGRADLVALCARHPLNRALRPGGLVLDALQTTTLAYLRREGDAIPFWRIATVNVDTLKARAASIGCGRVVELVSIIGGGSAPGITIPSIGIVLDGDHTAALRAWTPPVIARVEDGATTLDLRTVDPADDHVLRAALLSVLSERVEEPAR